MFYVYVLQSLKDKKFYIGYSSNLKRRLKEHKTEKALASKIRNQKALQLHLPHRRSGRHDKFYGCLSFPYCRGARQFLDTTLLQVIKCGIQKY